jgi:hypothetical protein
MGVYDVIEDDEFVIDVEVAFSQQAEQIDEPTDLASNSSISCE